MIHNTCLRLLSFHGTPLRVDPDSGTFHHDPGHDAPAGDVYALLPTIPGDRPFGVLILHDGIRIRDIAAFSPGAVPGTDGFSFAFLDGSGFLTAELNGSCSRTDRAGGWEAYRGETVEAPPPDVAALCLRLIETVRQPATAELLLDQVADTDAAAPWCATTLAWLLPREEARSAVSVLRDAPELARLYKGLQYAASNGATRYVFATRRMMAADIRRWGWDIGDHSYGAPDVAEAGLGMLRIGRYCSMNRFSVILGNHTTTTVTSYPFKTLTEHWPSVEEHPELEDHVAADVTIGNDVWIGRDALVLPGAVVGDGAVIGAHAVARGVVPPYGVVVGNPGRVIKTRFPEPVIARLLALRWWDWPDHLVNRYVHLLSGTDIAAFLDAAEADAQIARQRDPIGHG